MDVGCTSLQGFGASTNVTARSDLTTSVRLSNNPIFLKFHPHLQRYISVRMHPSVHPQHIRVLKHFYIYDMDVGCNLRGFGGSTMTFQQHHSVSPMHPIFQ